MSDVVIRFTRENALTLGLLVCRCGHAPNNHFRHIGLDKQPCAHCSCKEYREIARGGSVTTLESEFAEAKARAEKDAIRAHESRALLQRMAKNVREDNAKTAGTTRLQRLTVQVTDYLQRTHDPRLILRTNEQDSPGLLSPSGETKGGAG